MGYLAADWTLLRWEGRGLAGPGCHGDRLRRHATCGRGQGTGQGPAGGNSEAERPPVAISAWATRQPHRRGRPVWLDTSIARNGWVWVDACSAASLPRLHLSRRPFLRPSLLSPGGDSAGSQRLPFTSCACVGGPGCWFALPGRFWSRFVWDSLLLPPFPGSPSGRRFKWGCRPCAHRTSGGAEIPLGR